MNTKLSQVQKRDGSFEEFDINKIATAIKKAAEASNINNIELVKEISLKVFEKISAIETPTVEQIQDIVEKTLIEEGHAEIAKKYIIYRQKHSETREARKLIQTKSKIELSETALLVTTEKYLQKDSNGTAIETIDQMFERVANYIAQVEKLYQKDNSYINDLRQKFLNIMQNLQFVPAGRILANAGTKNKQLHSSFVLPVNDDISEIFKTVAMQTTLQKYGAGVGFSFSRLRPKDAIAKTSAAYAAGPVAFIEVFNAASNVIKQVSSRRAANMGSLSVHHPDVLEFIDAKIKKDALKNFNISVEITNEFMEAVLNDKKYVLIDPLTNRPIKELHARDVFSHLAATAWKYGEPGILFVDIINEFNSLPKQGKLETTDPCGDQPLLPYEGTVYGAINIAAFVKDNDLDWQQLQEIISIAVRFLDNCIDVSKTDYQQINELLLKNRKIGLGVMGFADMLYKLEIPYNSDEAVILAEKISKFLYDSAYAASKQLAEEKSPFPNIKDSKFKDKLRNASLITISPTGSRSLLADTSPGIEPNFALGYSRTLFDNQKIIVINKVVEEIAKKNNFYSEQLMKNLAKNGKFDITDNIPDKFADVFVTAHVIEPTWHLKIQAAFQQNIDNAVSKTINFPAHATAKDIEKAIILAYNLGVKGLTIYRDGSRKDQVINTIQDSDE